VRGAVGPLGPLVRKSPSPTRPRDLRGLCWSVVSLGLIDLVNLRSRRPDRSLAVLGLSVLTGVAREVI
jgi:hypothetical protein